MYIYTHLLISGFNGGPAGQPSLGPNGKALSQPKPHPSNRTLIEFVPRRLPTGRP